MMTVDYGYGYGGAVDMAAFFDSGTFHSFVSPCSTDSRPIVWPCPSFVDSNSTGECTWVHSHSRHPSMMMMIDSTGDDGDDGDPYSQNLCPSTALEYHQSSV